jgi:hypothetical protein
MRNHYSGSIGPATAVVALALLLAGASIAGQGQPGYKPPRTADGKPNLNGIWQALNTANWDIAGHAAQPAPFQNLVGVYLAEPAGLGVVDGGAIPYKPEALARRKQNFESRLKADPFKRDIGDPEAKCFMPGVPRATYMPFPFQIIQSTNTILVSYEYTTTTRIIYLGKVPPAPIDSWMGQSLGRWDGDTLVVDVTGLNGEAWLDRAGNFLSETAHVVERYTPVSPDHLTYEATIEDPNVFTRPWKMSMPLYRRIDKGMQLLEFKCVEFSEEFLYGTLRKQPK